MAKYDEVFIKRIREIYENTDISLNQLAKRESVGKATVVKWSQDFNWIKKNKTDRPPTDQIKNRPTEPTDFKKLKKQATKMYLEGKENKEIQAELGITRGSLDHIIHTGKLLVKRSMDTNLAIENARTKLFPDKEKETKEILEWQNEKLLELEERFLNEEMDEKKMFWNLKNISEIVKQKFQMIGIKYDKAIYEMSKAFGSLELDKERFEHDKASKTSDSKQENEVIDILKEAFGKDDG